MQLDIAAVDRDGALQEAEAAISGDTRASFFKKAGILGGGILAAGALPTLFPELASAASGDTAILNYALTLEELEAAFYKEAVMMGALSGATATFAKTVADHEAQHVAALRGVLGSSAIAKPSFDFQGTTSDQATFQKTAAVLEDTGVAAYKGQAPLVENVKVLEAALAIHAVEARHAAWIHHIIGTTPAPNAFDAPKTMDEVLAAVKATGFITASPSMTGTSSPSFTG